MKSCLLIAFHNKHSYKSLQGRIPSHSHLEREVLKNDGGKVGQHWELKLALLVPGEYILIFNGFLCRCCIAEYLGL